MQKSDMILKHCPAIHGGTDVISQPPRASTAHGACLLPRVIYGSGGGLYEPSGRAVPEGLSFRGVPAPHTPLDQLHTTVDTGSFPIVKDDLRYVYVGTINRHYGHFLIGAAARLWSLPAYGRDRLRLVYEASYTAEELFQAPHARSFFEALRLTKENFVTFREGVRFDRIDVPALAFEENSHVHKVYSETMRHVGRTICPAGSSVRSGSFTYLSKERVGSGNTRIANEGEITSYLRKFGVEVRFPEELSMEDQIRIWHTRSLIIGVVGSVLHTGVFVPPTKLLAINPGPLLWSNQVLIDRVSGHQATYLYPTRNISSKGPGDSFLNNYHAENPETLAWEIVNAAHASLQA